MPNILDRAISFVAPKWGAERQAYRQVSQMHASYTAAYPTRVSTPWSQSESLGGLPHLNLTVHRNLRDRARSLVENNPIASSILDRAVDNIVGPDGFQLQVLTADPTWNKQATLLMQGQNDNGMGWLDSADFNNFSWVQHQRLVCHGLLRDGDIGGALLSKGQVQLVPGDYISSPPQDRNAFLHDGIQLDPAGRVKSYSVMTYVDMQNRDWKPVAPKDMIFIANRRQVNQYRGETAYAQTFNLFDSQWGYLDAVVLAQKIAACLAIFITKKDVTGNIKGLSTGKNVSGQPQRKLKLEPGMVQVLENGEEISQTNPQQPGQGFSENMRMLFRIVGIAFGIPLEYILMDFSGVSGPTVKAATLAAQRTFERYQRQLIDEYYSRLYRWRISKFIKEGVLEDRPDSFNHRWHAAPWPYLDIVKEIQARQLAIDTGLSTLTRENIADNIDPVQIREERAKELADMRLKNIPIYHTAFVMDEPDAPPAPTGGIVNAS
jgi:lambda family phage portal protein